MALSIILPTFNESATIASTIASLREQDPAEIVVVDGGSTDATIAQARDADRIFQAPRGRAFQMNEGARQSQGDLLLFLHADCTLQPGALSAIEKTLQRPTVIAGCFSMRVQAAGFGFRAVDGCATARVRLTGIAYGDQGLFLRRTDFERLGGFPAVPFLEDVLFCQKLARQGRVVVLPQKIFVSPRRWRKVGLIHQSLRNWTLTALGLMGVAPERLAQYYPPLR